MADKLDAVLKRGMKRLGYEPSDEDVDAIIKIIAGSDEDDDDVLEIGLLTRLGGLCDDEAQALADHNRRMAWVAEQMMNESLGTSKETWEGLLEWRQKRHRIFAEWAAKESQGQDEYAETKRRTGEQNA